MEIELDRRLFYASLRSQRRNILNDVYIIKQKRHGLRVSDGAASPVCFFLVDTRRGARRVVVGQKYELRQAASRSVVYNDGRRVKAESLLLLLWREPGALETSPGSLRF